jgi:hypothetical protein
MKTISTEELQEKLSKSDITLIEVLGEEEYKKAHISQWNRNSLKKSKENVR